MQTTHIKMADRTLRFVASDSGECHVSAWKKTGYSNEPKRLGGYEVTPEQMQKAMADAIAAGGVQVADVYA